MITTDVQTRGYELDGTRSIPAAILIRYMEWGRWEFLNSDQTGFRQSINSLVVASQSLMVLAPISERIDLEIHIWLSRVGTTSLDISQMIVHKKSKSPVAMGRATLVNVDSKRRPHPVSEGAQRFVETSPLAFTDTEFLKIHTNRSPHGSKSMERRVMASEIDLLQHVNHSRYVDYVEDARKLLFPLDSNETMPISGLTIEYRNEALLGQQLTINVWPTAAEATFQSQIQHQSTIVANAIVRLL